MTKSEAYSILHNRISDMCINDVIYGLTTGDKDETYLTMIAILSDILATNEVLYQLVGMADKLNGGEKHGNNP